MPGFTISPGALPKTRQSGTDQRSNRRRLARTLRRTDCAIEAAERPRAASIIALEVASIFSAIIRDASSCAAPPPLMNFKVRRKMTCCISAAKIAESTQVWNMAILLQRRPSGPAGFP
jgi:hypothetical protein